jgi:CheY-like chemotaxis protein
MARVQLLHWKASEAGAYLELLKAAGHQVNYEPEFTTTLLRSWRESPPDAFVIDLSRLPSHGREIAGLLRQSRATRHVPIVFCEGAEEKVARVRSELPDATYCTRKTLRSLLRRAMQARPEAPVVPREMMQRYAGRSAAQKLGIQEGSRVELIDAPRNWPKILGNLPKSVEFFENYVEKINVILCFVENAASLQHWLSKLRGRAAVTKLWVLWRKGGSVARGEVAEQMVRERGIDLGLVDYKICSVNEVWSALLFAQKRSAIKPH